METNEETESGLKIPSSWIRCPAIGSLVQGLFIPMKTPLSEDFHMERKDNFTAQMAIFYVQNVYPKKSILWVDLTKKPYYDKQVLTDYGITYASLPIESPDKCPTLEDAEEFIELCSEILQKDRSTVIVINDSLGFNACGLMIAAYIVLHLHRSADYAVQEFAKCRPPGIYRQDYINELFKFSGNTRCTPRAPEKPDWLAEIELVDKTVPVSQTKERSTPLFGEIYVGETSKKMGSKPRKLHETFIDEQEVHKPLLTEQKKMMPEAAAPTSIMDESSSEDDLEPVSSPKGAGIYTREMSKKMRSKPRKLHETFIDEQEVHISTPKNRIPPPGWMECSPRGSVVGAKFVPFKSPLDRTYNVPNHNVFTPERMLDSAKSVYTKPIGLWVNITDASSQFYDEKVIEDRDVQYFKLECEGDLPTEKDTAIFIEICKKFLKKNRATQIIGIHSLYGYNRAGFFIVSYLVEKDGWNLETALEAFQKARPPGIFKEALLNLLFKRYKKGKIPRLTPEAPSWYCKKKVSDDDTGIKSIEKQDFISKKMPNLMKRTCGLKEVSTAKSSAIAKKCQNICGWRGSGFPGMKPTSLDKYNIQQLQNKDYRVTWKTNGTRYFLLINKTKENFVMDEDNSVFQIDCQFPQKNATEHLHDTLLDGEMVTYENAGQLTTTYLIFDIIHYQGMPVAHSSYKNRVSVIKEIIAARDIAMREKRIDASEESFRISLKKTYEITDTEKIITPAYRNNIPFQITGLIFQPVPNFYTSGSAPEVFMWSPLPLCCIEFKLYINKAQDIRAGKRMGKLFLQGTDVPFGQIEVTKELAELNNKIIKCHKVGKMWHFKNACVGKTKPYHVNDATNIMNSIVYHLSTLEIIDATK